MSTSKSNPREAKEKRKGKGKAKGRQGRRFTPEQKKHVLELVVSGMTPGDAAKAGDDGGVCSAVGGRGGSSGEHAASPDENAESGESGDVARGVDRGCDWGGTPSAGDVQTRREGSVSLCAQGSGTGSVER